MASPRREAGPETYGHTELCAWASGIRTVQRGFRVWHWRERNGPRGGIQARTSTLKKTRSVTRDGCITRRNKRACRRQAERRRRHWFVEWKKGRRNPAESAAAVYEEFHGMPSTRVTEVVERSMSIRTWLNWGGWSCSLWPAWMGYSAQHLGLQGRGVVFQRNEGPTVRARRLAGHRPQGLRHQSAS